MRKSYRFLAAFVLACLMSLSGFAQTTVISGNVKNNVSKENVGAVSVVVKGSSQGTFTDDNGNFRFTTSTKLPLVLVISSIGFDNLEVTVTNANENVQAYLAPSSQIGQEVVVSATRTQQRLLDAPVTVERMGGTALKSLAAPNFYEAITNLKGVDMHTASLTFRTVTTRGFVSSGNTRLNQLIDGMDNQAPGLNFSVGSVIGLTELDVDNVELLSGASSALYGSGGMNGTLLINSKNPFKYQGLSFNVKQGIMHTDGKQRSPSPYFDWTARWAKAFNNKLAFKISGQLVKANDWQADDYRNVQRTNVISSVKGGNRSSDPNYDGVNTYGDETSASMSLVSQAILFSPTNNPSLTGVIQNLTTLLGRAPTQGEILNFYATTSNPALATLKLFAVGLTQNMFAGTDLVSRTGYEEKHLVDYNTLNFKVNAGLHYKITPGIEASWNSYMGTGTTVYTGADRYSLRGLKMAQHKLEVRHKNWFLRGYTTQENAGESYNATVLGRLINELWRPSASSWYPTYIATYVTLMQNNGGNKAQAHQLARTNADVGRLIPGTAAFENAKKQVRSLPIPAGALFLDKTDLWAGEGQLNFSDALGFSDKLEVMLGAQWKQYVLNSQGTLFADTAGRIKINEYGGYIQLKKRLFEDRLTLTAAGRYDKHTNFDGRFTPRVTAVVKLFKDNNIRFSYQTAYRFPTNQNQYINLNVGSGILIGGLPEFQTKYNLIANPGYTAQSVEAFRAAYAQTGNPNTSLLVKANFSPMKPESVTSYEAGYKGVLFKKLMLDAYVYYSEYANFLGGVAVAQSASGAATDLLNPLATRNYSYNQNSTELVKALGWGLTAEYQLPRGFVAYGNVFTDQLKDVPAGIITYFNAPFVRYNIGLRNENVWKGIGFNAVWKWQDNNYYEGTFATGWLPYFGWMDAQITYKMPKTKSTFRIGATNIGNSYYRTGFGSPAVGGLYYASYGYNL